MNDNVTQIMETLRQALEKSWNADTCWHKNEFDPERPSAGQCYVTSLCLLNFFKTGSIIGAEILYKRSYHSHYWFSAPNGIEYDLTSDQFGGDGIHPMRKSLIFGRWIVPKPDMRNKRYRRLKKQLILNLPQSLNKTMTTL
jgi:hypothetical protein